MKYRLLLYVNKLQLILLIYESKEYKVKNQVSIKVKKI